jgi:hypothetical protein
VNPEHPSFITMQWIREWWPVLWPLTMVAAGVVLLWMKSQFPTLANFEKAKDRLTGIEDRLDHIETAVKAFPSRDEVQDLRLELVGLTQRISHLPARDDVHEMGLELRDVKGEIASLKASMSPMQMSVARIEDYLLNGGRK